MRICMILEGSYPFVVGGVSSWTNQYIQAMKEHEFVLWCIGADSKDRDKFKYKLPENVVEVNQVFLNDAFNTIKGGKKKLDSSTTKIRNEYIEIFKNLIIGENADWGRVFEIFYDYKMDPISLLMTPEFLESVKKACMEKFPYMSFADYFHTVRSMLLPELYLITQPIPQADIYHATATGYSGILGSLAKKVTGKPFILTEHGIYTREREEELIRAKWVLPSFRKQWINLFYNFSSCAYKYADRVTSLYEAASVIQADLGCDEKKLSVIANGVHSERFKDVPMKTENGYIDIGAVIRIAKIKDVKTLIYAFAELKTNIPNARLHILGDVDDKEYKKECDNLIEMLGVKDIIFTGIVNVIEYMENFDFTILTSISEAQPLSVLESFAARRPAVTTDVGCCRELLFGNKNDHLGSAGYIAPPMFKEGLANAMEKMCTDKKMREEMGIIGQQRVEKYYTHEISMNNYRKLYQEVTS